MVQAYRNAIDACFDDITYYSENIEKFSEEVNKVSHREYYTGFYYGYQGEKGQNYKNSSYIRDWELVAVVKGYDTANKLLIVSERNKFNAGETVEFRQLDETVTILGLDGFMCSKCRKLRHGI